jgi:quinol monooxygenase YgiN
MRTILSGVENDCQTRLGDTGPVLVVNRFRVPEPEAPAFRDDLERARRALAARPGHVDSHVGRNVDDPTLWTLVSRWEHVGAYRRALSAYDVKLYAVPVLGRAIEEPSAYEPVEPGADLNVVGSRSLG